MGGKGWWRCDWTWAREREVERWGLQEMEEVCVLVSVTPTTFLERRAGPVNQRLATVTLRSFSTSASILDEIPRCLESRQRSPHCV
ncbi:hypothetical protein IE53DRAFT_389513 [Violaceomyces palustris]|uniref:Uncharacterized protein n=1 Tax=Violaceomyces palustris TaxID=1673888 RepID=A0ACD0NR95_9BASI|nr:hypothetical protein IE53DRAFT_389513 [Violaceomyces palustris]